MKFRSLGVLLVLVLALAAGCQKDEEPERDKPTSEEKKAAQKESAPEGFARLEEEDDIFITERPIRVEEFVQYVNTTGQDIPDRLQSPDIDYQDPVTGLNEEQAKELAHFLKMRLPTSSEWEQARDVVGDTPYPWGDEATEETVIHFVRDDEEVATERHQKLMNEISKMHRDKIRTQAEELKQLEETMGEEISDQWQTFKDELTDLIETQKENARMTARRKNQETVLKILRRVGEKKQQIIHAQFKDDASDEDIKEAKKTYSAFLKEQRDQLQELTNEVVETNQTLSEKARKLMEKLETEANTLIHDINNTTEGYVERAETVDGPETLGALRGRLERELGKLKNAADHVQREFQKTQEELAETAEELKKQAKQSEDDQTVEEETKEIKEKIKGLNEHIEEELDQEPHFFTELEEYTELAATKKTLEREVDVLQKAIDIFDISEQTATETEDAETEDVDNIDAESEEVDNIDPENEDDEVEESADEDSSEDSTE